MLVGVALAVLMLATTAAALGADRASAHGLTSPQRAAYRQLRDIEAHRDQIVEGSFREQMMATSTVRHDCRVLLRAHLGAAANAALRVIASVPVEVTGPGRHGTAEARRFMRALKTLVAAVRRAE